VRPPLARARARARSRARAAHARAATLGRRSRGQRCAAALGRRSRARRCKDAQKGAAPYTDKTSQSLATVKPFESPLHEKSSVPPELAAEQRVIQAVHALAHDARPCALVDHARDVQRTSLD
jgi:hypothetical protein